MKVVKAASPDEGLQQLLRCLYTRGNHTRADSRNGPVIRFNEPFTMLWEQPKRRVSFDPVRDANPFFHLFEAFWMLAGQRDVKRAAYFAGSMAQYSDDGTHFAAAYGYRWRHHFGVDQIDDYILPSLKVNKDDRRCVLAMWDGDTDIVNGQAGGRDLACNLNAVFDAGQGVLDMTVTNRSNDSVLGLTGANVVHFSMLQEYVAGCLGLPIGRYWQVSTNAHVYTEFDAAKRMLQQFRKVHDGELEDTSTSYYGRIIPLFDVSIDPDLKKLVIDRDTMTLMENYDQTHFSFESNFFCSVVQPMMVAFNQYKQDHLEEALEQLKGTPVHSDWSVAGTAWLERRIDSRNELIMKMAQQKGETSQESWTAVLKKVWPSAVARTIKTDIGDLPAYEAEVWSPTQRTNQLKIVGTWSDGMATIKERGIEYEQH